MTEKTPYEKQASNLLKAELVRRGMNYDDLRIVLEKIGVIKSTRTLAKTISEGKFKLAFFLQCAEAIGFNEIKLK